MSKRRTGNDDIDDAGNVEGEVSFHDEVDSEIHDITADTDAVDGPGDDTVDPNAEGKENIDLVEGEDAPDAGMIGQFVQYVLDEGPSKGQVRPALVVRSWNHEDTGEVMLQLQVFMDSDQEGRFNDQLGPMLWKSTVSKGDGETPGTWF